MIVYKITNKITGKAYIGCTKNTLTRRWQQHVSKANTNPNCHFHRSILKHGVDCWLHEIIYTTNDTNDMLDMERQLIKEHDTYINGYNSSIGGEHRTTMKGENNPMFGVKRDLTGSNNPMFGRVHTDHSKKLIGDSHRGHSRKWGRHSDETKQKIRDTQRAKMISCTIKYDSGEIKAYPSLKALARSEGIDYQRVKQVARSNSGYSRKHKCKIIV